MRNSMKKLVAAFSTAVVLTAGTILTLALPAAAAEDPAFKVTCFPTGMAQLDPIVYPGQTGKGHLHTFFGAKGVDQNTTVDTLMARPTSQCGAHFDAVDRSAYWIPTLQQNGQAVYTDSGSHQLAVYYRKAGGPGGAPVAQAMPQGLRIIAGDMHATTPQLNVSYACAKASNNGVQRGGTPGFTTCGADEIFIAKLVFPDCWNGVDLDSADHKSHMAFSSGPRMTCPATHPVKVPQVTFEAWYHNTDLSRGGLGWSSGGAYSFHGDIMAGWDPRAAANLVNQCVNGDVNCLPLMYESIPQGPVTQAQIDAQLGGATSPATTPPTTGHDGHGTTPTPTPSATPAPVATPAPTSPAATTPPATDPPATTTPKPKPKPKPFWKWVRSR